MERKILDFCELQIRNCSSLLLTHSQHRSKHVGIQDVPEILSSIQGVTFQSMNVHSESYIPPRKWSVQWFEFYSDQIRRSSSSLHVIDALHFPSHHIITGAWQLDTTYLDSLCLGSRQTLFKLAYSRTLEITIMRLLVTLKIHSCAVQWLDADVDLACLCRLLL